MTLAACYRKIPLHSINMILDQYNNPISTTRKLIHASDESRTRGPQFGAQNKSIEELITERDRDVIVALSLRLFCNMGPFKSVVNQKSTYSVGVAWLPTYKGPDKENGEIGRDWLVNTLFKSLDVRGGIWDWWTKLEQVSKESDVRGDHFTLLTVSEDGESPRIKNIPAHAVRTKCTTITEGKCVVKSGEWTGHKISHGIIYNDNDRALAYRVSTGRQDNQYTDIPAASMIHCFDATLSDGGRGLPVASHALEDLKHILQSTEYERSRQLILSSIGLFVENETGGPDMSDPRFAVQDSATTTGEVFTTQEVSPQIWYAQAGNNEKITQLKHETGGDSYESFQDRMIRSFVAGCDWSYSLTWKPTGQGTAERGEILRARKAIVSRQKMLNAWALKVVSYCYAFENARGRLPDLENPFGWEFTRPARLSVDDGREGKMLNEGYRLGKYNMSDLLEFEGRTEDEHLEQRAMESVKRQLKIQEKFEEYGVMVEKRELVMLTPNEVATPPEPTTQNNEDDEQ